MKDMFYYINKLCAISFIAICYVTLGVTLSITMERIFRIDENINKVEQKWHNQSTIYLVLQIYLECILIVIGAYFIRNVIKKIPYIFEGYSGFHYRNLRECNGTVITTLSIILFIPNLKKKMLYVAHERFGIFQRK